MSSPPRDPWFLYDPPDDRADAVTVQAEAVTVDPDAWLEVFAREYGAKVQRLSAPQAAFPTDEDAWIFECAAEHGATVTCADRGAHHATPSASVSSTEATQGWALDQTGFDQRMAALGASRHPRAVPVRKGHKETLGKP